MKEKTGKSEENITELTADNFNEKTKKGKWIVDFWASWCGPCIMMGPHFATAAKKFKGKVNFGKLDVEAHPEISSKFEVMSIPTSILFKDGEQINRKIGAMPEDLIVSLIEETFE